MSIRLECDLCGDDLGAAPIQAPPFETTPLPGPGVPALQILVLRPPGLACVQPAPVRLLCSECHTATQEEAAAADQRVLARRVAAKAGKAG